MGTIKFRHLTINLFGEDYVFIGEGNHGGKLEDGGAIAKEEDYKKFIPGYAYLRSDGRIMRNGRQIGTRDDIIVTGEKDIEISEDLITEVATAVELAFILKQADA